MAKKPAKKTAAKKTGKARKVAAKKRAVKRAPRKSALPVIEKPQTTVVAQVAKPEAAVVTPVAKAERLNRDEKNALRKQLQADLKAEKDPVKRTALRRAARPLLKY